MKYCTTVHVYVYAESGKIKAQIGTVPVEIKNDKMTAVCSNEVFNLKKKSKIQGTCIQYRFWNHYRKPQREIYFQAIYDSDKDFENAEREFLPKVEKFLARHVIGMLDLRKFLHSRIEQLTRS